MDFKKRHLSCVKNMILAKAGVLSEMHVACKLISEKSYFCKQ
jgi:hypothetical protein